MSFALSVLKELFSLFVDDGNLALQVLVLIAAVTALVRLAGLAPLAAGMLLLLGCLAILAVSLRRALRR
ncbi:MAG: hypothetical protein GC146_11325 [Limimaricola sp.]|uniref:hypothetical protein n=1 Tax=Limimaricola sp. TaxID=2211665 RepID=UPI001DB85232|nr:hypothetical protein [Limimaricola sp.]MBI1417804.1 hypothetical protein [Limimaricola sp.]